MLGRLRRKTGSVVEFATGTKRGFRDAAQNGECDKLRDLYDKQKQKDIECSSDYDPNRRHKGGKTPEEEASENGHWDVVSAIREEANKTNVDRRWTALLRMLCPEDQDHLVKTAQGSGIEAKKSMIQHVECILRQEKILPSAADEDALDTHWAGLLKGCGEGDASHLSKLMKNSSLTIEQRWGLLQLVEKAMKSEFIPSAATMCGPGVNFGQVSPAQHQRSAIKHVHNDSLWLFSYVEDGDTKLVGVNIQGITIGQGHKNGAHETAAAISAAWDARTETPVGSYVLCNLAFTIQCSFRGYRSWLNNPVQSGSHSSSAGGGGSGCARDKELYDGDDGQLFQDEETKAERERMEQEHARL
eukprot:g2307.t1